MQLTQNFIGKEVRRIVFSLKTSAGDYYHIFSILEKVEVDMQDYLDFANNHGNEYNDFIKGANGREDKLFLTIDRITVTKELFERPWEYCYSGETQFRPTTCDYQWPAGENEWRIIPSDENTQTELKSLLPRRTCPSYVRYCIPNGEPEIIKHVLTENSLRAQLTELSIRNLGYDLSVHKVFLGGFVFLLYNNIYRRIVFSEKESRDGIYCRLDYIGKRQPLTICCKRIANDKGIVGIDQFVLDGYHNLYDLTFKGPFHSLEVSILDKQGDLIDFYNRLVFIHSIHFNMRVGNKEVHLQDGKGNTIKTVKKYTEGDRVVIGAKNLAQGLLDSSPEYSYRKFEEALDFVFYDGDKAKEEQNIAKANKDILRILNSAGEKVYICDVFFDVKSLQRFVIPMESGTVPVRILSGKKELKTDGMREKLANAIKELNEKGISNIECRLLTGRKAELHDRFIIADDQVWILGCSMNEFGNRATTLIRVPKDYRKKLVNRVEEWWNDESLTENINES